MINPTPNRPSSSARGERRPWESPRVTDLPRLTELTLTTGSGIPGSGSPSGGGSTVIP